MNFLERANKFTNLDFKKILLNKYFLAILALKILFSLTVGSDFLIKGFIPFIDYFVSSGFKNPYDYFLSIGDLKAFPYSSVMLWILSAPRVLLYFLFDSNKVGFLDIFVARIPVLIFDVFIYLLLCKWLKTKEKEVLLFYWASPILIYINYIYGQLDIIPTAMLFLSLAFLFARKLSLSFLILGVGFAIKTHIFAALPFYIIYLYVNKNSVLEISKLILLSILTYFVLNFPYLFSDGYMEIVLKASEQKRLFLLSFPYDFENIKFLITPAAYFVLFARFISYKKINQDMFILILGLVFSVLVTLVPAPPGWFYWSIPFLSYFYIKYEKAPSVNFWILNIFFILYFIFGRDGVFLESFQLISPYLSGLKDPYDFMISIGLNADLISNLLFTGLVGAMAMNVLWCYKAGIKSNFEYKDKDRPILIGIGGDSGAGKSTFAESLENLFGKKNTICVNGDDVHKWPRGHQNWNVFTHLNPSSNNLHTELNHAIALKDGKFIERVHYDHDTGQFTDPNKMGSNKFILFVGLHTYYIKKMRDVFDLKIFIEPDESLRKHWKILRDMEYRGYSKEKVLEQLAKREEDSNKYIKPQRGKADIVFSYCPVKEIKDLGSKSEQVEIKLKIHLDNSIYIEPLIEKLSQINSLSLESWHEGDLDNQCVEVFGDIKSNELNQILYDLVPNVRDLIFNEEIQWESGYKGISQLFVIYYLSEISKLEKVLDE